MHLSHAKSSGDHARKLHNTQIRGVDKGTVTSDSMHLTHAKSSGEKSRTLHNTQIRGVDKGTVTADSMHLSHATSAPKPTSTVNANVRGTGSGTATIDKVTSHQMAAPKVAGHIVKETGYSGSSGASAEVSADASVDLGDMSLEDI